MNNLEYYLQIFKYVTIIVCTLIVSVMSSCQVSKYTLVELTERADNDPIAAACAITIYDSQGITKNECTLYLATINRRIDQE